MLPGVLLKQYQNGRRLVDTGMEDTAFEPFFITWYGNLDVNNF